MLTFYSRIPYNAFFYNNFRHRSAEILKGSCPMNMLVVDGNSVINRAYYGVRPLTTRDGRPTHAVYGFLTMLDKIMADVAPDAVAIAFDMRAPTFRHLKYSGYKAKRKGMPDELASQMQPLKDILAALGYKIVTCEGWEADDILGTLALSCSERGSTCVIATGDRDTLQLVGENVSVRLLSTKDGHPNTVTYDVAAIKEKYGVEPRQLIDIKAIQGDSSDNIPGVPGIGEKGALDLISRFGSLDNVYANIESPDIKAGVKKKLAEGRESAYLSYWLGTVQCDAPVPTDPADYAKAAPDAGKVRSLMTDLELFSLLKKMRLPEAGEVIPQVSEEAPAEEVEVKFGTAAECIEQARAAGVLDFVWAQEGDKMWAAVCSPESVCLLADGEGEQLICELSADEGVKKRTHDLKPLARILLRKGIRPAGFAMDTKLAAYLVNPSANDYSLTRLTEQYLGVSPINLPPFLEKAKDASRFSKLCDCVADALEKGGMTALLRDIEIPLAIVLADMENAGFAVDSEGITAFGDSLEGRIAQLEKDICAEVGYEFNINSPKQLGEALFGKLQLPGGKKTKTGYSTSADVLEGLRGSHPVPDMVLEYRSLAKLNSTYCRGLVKEIQPDGRIHTTFNQTETRTGRISSTEPNLQNIPVRTELGRELRKFFAAAKGNMLIDADYSQIELRVLAHMANDAAMINAFNSGADIHRITASQAFGVAPEEVTPEMRSAAKAVNFGIVYGISAFSLGKDIGVPTRQAQAYIDGYMKTYPAIAAFMKDVVAQAAKDGFVQTMYNRRRYLPELAASNHNVRSFGERVARNMPIQGTAADIIKLAMVRVYDRLKKDYPEARLIMQVHDELIVEAPEAQAEGISAVLKEEMEAAAQLSVALIADAHVGKNWLEAKD